MNSTLRATTVAAFVALTTTPAFALPNPTDVFPAQGGPIRITPIYHASFQIEYAGKVFQVDPFSAGDFEGAKLADFILITHTHPDHLDPAGIREVERGNFAHPVHVFGPPSVIEQVKKLRSTGIAPQMRLSGLITQTLRNGQIEVFNSGPDVAHQKPLFTLEAVPMYNIVRGPKPGQKFHPKGQFDGFILTLGGKRIYIAGDTEATPEMKALKNIDIAFLPMNLPYTMTPQEAAQGARAFKPKVVYPYHYRFPFNKPNDNPQQFQKALAGSGIDVRIRNWYGHVSQVAG